MARVTVEDCIENVPNRFELVVLASQRAKQISAGAPLTVDRDNDKDAVVALREIADKTIDTSSLLEEIVVSQCRRKPAEEFEAAPFAGEIEDRMREDAAARTKRMQEDMDMESLMEDSAEMPQGMHFEEENIDIED